MDNLLHWWIESLFSSCSNLERSSFTFLLPLQSKWIPRLFSFFIAISYFGIERDPSQKFKAFTNHFSGINLRAQRQDHGLKSKSD